MKISTLIFIYTIQFSKRAYNTTIFFITGMHIKTNLLGTELFHVISKRFEMHLLEHMFLTDLLPFML